MQGSPTIRIDLPAETVDLIRRKVETGEYTSEIEVIRTAFRLLEERDAQRSKAQVADARFPHRKARAFGFGRMFGY